MIVEPNKYIISDEDGDIATGLATVLRRAAGENYPIRANHLIMHPVLSHKLMQECHAKVEAAGYVNFNDWPDPTMFRGVKILRSKDVGENEVIPIQIIVEE